MVLITTWRSVSCSIVPFPAVDRLHRRQQVDARGEPLLDDARPKAGPSASAGSVVRTITYSWVIQFSSTAPGREPRFSRDPYFPGASGRNDCTKDCFQTLCLPRETPRDVRRGGGVEPLRRKRVVARPAACSASDVHLLLVFVTRCAGRGRAHRRKGADGVDACAQAVPRPGGSLEDAPARECPDAGRGAPAEDDPAAIESVAREELGLIRPAKF